MSMTVLPDGTCSYRLVVPPAPAAVPGAGDRTPSMRVGVMKKRGRPRRYGPSRPVVARIASSSVTSPVAVRGLEDDGFMSGSAPVGTVSPLAAMTALGTRESLTPYAINIKAGLDISSIISSFSQQGHVSVLSANGVVSQVVLHQEANLGGTIAYEGRFEILLLSGQLLGKNDLCSQTGGLTVLLAGPNSRVFGGRLAGILIAASPVQDVSSKIMSFSQNGPRAVCILSANGAISNVTLRQAATSGGTVTYEGRFEILSLSGSFLLSDNGGHRSRTGGLSVSLAGPDGHVLGGGVAGLFNCSNACAGCCWHFHCGWTEGI